MSRATIYHLSDLHFHCVPRNPSQWLGKRALGALNLIFNRRRLYPLERAQKLVRVMSERDWDHLIITGDITQLALEEEFELAHQTLAPLLERGPERVTILPGNHDRYVKTPDGKNGFDTWFGRFFGKGEIGTRELSKTWKLVAWDSTLPTPPFMAWGRVRKETLRATEDWLGALPKGSRVILANHYPLYFKPPFQYVPSHEMRGIREVRRWVANHPIELYLHGHLHINWVRRVTRHDHTCTHVNSASSTQNSRSSRRSAFHRIELDGAEFEVFPERY